MTNNSTTKKQPNKTNKDKKQKFQSVLHVIDDTYRQPYNDFAPEMRFKVMDPETAKEYEERKKAKEQKADEQEKTS